MRWEWVLGPLWLHFNCLNLEIGGIRREFRKILRFVAEYFENQGEKIGSYSITKLSVDNDMLDEMLLNAIPAPTM